MRVIEHDLIHRFVKTHDIELVMLGVGSDEEICQDAPW
jgi:hypothetical protein